MPTPRRSKPPAIVSAPALPAVQQALAAALAHGDEARQLAALLELWRTYPAPALADRIDLVSDRLTERIAPLGDGPRTKLDALHAAFVAREKRRDPIDFGLLVAAVRRQRSATALGELAALQRWPADPRATTFLARTLEDRAPWTAEAYAAVLALAERSGDPRLIPLCRGNVTARLDCELQGRAIPVVKRRAVEIADAVAARFPHGAPALALPPDRGAPTAAGTDRAAALLAQVYARPDDLEARRVYGDLLAADGDPRGDLILLQTRTGTKARAEALLAKHAKEWRGPLAAFTEHEASIWFERGFPHRVSFDASASLPAIARTRHDPWWSTVENLSLSRISCGLLESPHLGNVRTVGLGDGVADLLARGRSYAWTTVTVSAEAPRVGELGALLPRLETLRLYANLVDMAALWSSPLLARVRSLHVHLVGKIDDLGAWLADLLAHAPPGIERFELPVCWRGDKLVLTSTPHRRFSVLAVDHAVDWRLDATIANRWPRDHFTAATLAVRGRAKPADVAATRAALQALVVGER